MTGYGVIEPDDGSSLVYVDISAVESAGLSELRKGQKVSFDVVQRLGRASATDLKLPEFVAGEGPA